MTREEILTACTWNAYDQATLTVTSALFNREVEVLLLPGYGQGHLVTDRMAAVLSDFLALTSADLPTVRQLLWADCLDSLANISYGVDVQPGETELAANQREFNLYSAEDAYAQSNLSRLSIPHEPKLRHRYGAIEFEPEWAGHGCSLILQDGRLLATSSNDWYFSQYETGEAAPAT